MSTSLETELTRTLAAAAEVGPAPTPEFVDVVRGRRRQRRQRRMAVLGAAAVAITAAVGIGAVQVLGQPTPSSGQLAGRASPPPPPADRVPRIVGVRPVQEVWPDAVRTLPGRLPDGRRYTLAAILGGGRYLVAPLKPAGRTESAGELLQWEPATRSVIPLGRAVPAGDYAGMTVGWRVAVGEGHVAWIARGILPEGRIDFVREGYQEVWVAPLGKAGHRVAIVDTATINSNIQIVAGHVVWSQRSESAVQPPNATPPVSGLFRIPLSGGTPQRLPDSDGYVLMSTAPWAEQGNENFSGPQQWNLADGHRRPVLAGDYSTFRCSPDWCIGRTSADWHMFARRLNGTDAVTTDFTGDFYFTANDHIAMGHAPATGPAAAAKRLLWDVENGQTASYPDQDYDPGTTNARGMPYWLGRGGELNVVDTAAIG